MKEAVFCFTDKRNPDVHATYSACFNRNNKVLRTIFRKRFTLPQRRLGRQSATSRASTNYNVLVVLNPPSAFHREGRCRGTVGTGA